MLTYRLHADWRQGRGAERLGQGFWVSFRRILHGRHGP